MQRLASFLLALCMAHGVQAQTPRSAGTLADTVRVDALLDSAKAEVARGETETPVTLAGEAARLLDVIRHKDPGWPGLHERLMQAYKFEAIGHHYAGRYAPALAGFIKMEREADTLGSAKDVAAALTYQGYEYRATGDLERAGEVTRRAIAALRTMPEDIQLANALAGMGTLLYDLQEWDSSMHYQRASAAMHRRLGNAAYEALSRMDMAVLYTKFQQYDSAFAEMQLAKPVLMADSNITQQVVLLVQEARVLVGLGRLAEARRNLDQALPSARHLGGNEAIQHIQELHALINAAEGRFPQAIQMQDSARMALLKDLDLAKVQEVAAVRLEGEHAKERALDQARMDEVQAQKRYALIGFGLLLVIAALLFLQLHTVRRKNKEVTKAHRQVVEAEKQREAEEVRTRIARDIHDDIGSGLTKIAMLGNEAKLNMKVSVEALSATLDRMINHSREVSASLGDIVWAVDPTTATADQLVGHARQLALRLLEHAEVEQVLEFHAGQPELPVAPDLKHNVLMVMKEAIHNALKYAQATRIAVRLDAPGNQYTLTVQDNGRGFDPVQSAATGNGLHNMQARAEAIGARITIESKPGEGCTIRLEGTLA